MLVTKEKIRTYRSISKAVKDDKINPYIKDAERLDVKPLLGELLFRDISKNPTDAIYIDVLEPKEYDYNDETYGHDGLEEIISIFAWARYVFFGSNTDTAFGHVKKNYQDGEAVSYQEKKNIYTKERQTALILFEEVEKFLDRNSETYPLWKNGSCGSRPTPRIRISKITT